MSAIRKERGTAKKHRENGGIPPSATQRRRGKKKLDVVLIKTQEQISKELKQRGERDVYGRSRAGRQVPSRNGGARTVPNPVPGSKRVICPCRPE